jgi:hypothetical protein
MATVIQVVRKVVEKDTRRGSVWEIELGDGQTVSTFDRALGERAIELTDQPAKLEVNTQTKGRYVNHYLDAIESTDAPVSGGLPAASGAGRSGGSGSNPDETANRIARTSGLRMAVDEAIAAGEPGNVDFAVAEGYTKYILTGQRPE